HNSHQPPASDTPEVPKKKKKKTRKKRGGQVGHVGHSRKLYPLEECSKVIEHYPQKCKCCGEELTGEDTSPYRHQIVEIPPIKLYIEEHRLHHRECSHCGEKTRAQLPAEVETSGYGERVAAIVSVMSRMYRHSHNMVVSAMSDYFGVYMSVGSVNRLRKEASVAVEKAVAEAKAYIQSAPQVGADETGFRPRKC
ncbi:MAG: IS66 family transposase, partial [Moorea sp. SIO4G2]|nr:IS66 family transposase [Moorena sp. SIO4G2]